MPDHVGYDPEIGTQGHDPVEAERLLEALSWSRNVAGNWELNGQLLQLDLTFPSGTVYEELAGLIQQQLDDFGIKVQLDRSRSGQLQSGNFAQSRLQRSATLWLGIRSGSGRFRFLALVADRQPLGFAV